MTPRHPKLSSRLKASLYSTLALLWVTGGAWMAWHWHAAHQSLEMASTPPSWIMKLHGAVAIMFYVVFGVMLPLHVRIAWHQARQRFVGALVIVWVVALSVSGWMLYYIGGETLREATSKTHTVAGIILPLLLAFHIALARRLR